MKRSEMITAICDTMDWGGCKRYWAAIILATIEELGMLPPPKEGMVVFNPKDAVGAMAAARSNNTWEDEDEKK